MKKYFILFVSDSENVCRKLSYGVIEDSNTNKFSLSFNNSMIDYLVFDELQLDDYYNIIETLKPYTEEITL